MTATVKIILWAGIVVALAALLVFGGDGIMYFKKIIAPARFGSGDNDGNLLAENTALKTELEKLLYLEDAVVHFRPEFLAAAVYSRYPWSSKNEITLSAGSAHGVRVGMPVIVSDTLIGIVRGAYPNYSVAVTVFDKGLEIPVKIGSSGVNGLFTGGAIPRVTLIPRAAKVMTGDGVYSVSADMPYGLTLGSIGEVSQDNGGTSKKAALVTPLGISDLRAVSVITNYK